MVQILGLDWAYCVTDADRPVAAQSIEIRFQSSISHQNPRLPPVLNPPFLLITRTKSGFYLEFGPNMQGSCFLA